ncbi:MAG: hypothetical protein RPU60_09165 [Candidatus Sedimenticola sp. (ex Thyasira tokunagai)]
MAKQAMTSSADLSLKVGEFEMKISLNLGPQVLGVLLFIRELLG